MNNSLMIRNLFDLNHTAAAPLLEKYTYPWEALPEIGSFITRLGPTLPENEYEQRWANVWIHKSARLYPNCYIGGPCIIGPNTEVRPGALIRPPRPGPCPPPPGSGHSTPSGRWRRPGPPGEPPPGSRRGTSPPWPCCSTPRGRRLHHLQREAGQNAGYGAHGGGKSLHRPEKVRRHAGRPCGDRLQLRSEPGHGRGPGQPCVSPFHGAGAGACGMYL